MCCKQTADSIQESVMRDASTEAVGLGGVSAMNEDDTDMADITREPYPLSGQGFSGKDITVPDAWPRFLESDNRLSP